MAAFLRPLTQNWQLKLLAFVLAVLIWVVVSAEQVTSNWIPVPLEVRVSDPAYTLVPASAPREVEVRFSGPGREMWDMVIRRPPLRLAISTVEGTAEVFALDPRMVQVPNRLSVTAQDVRPGSVRLRFTETAERTLPVQVRVRSQLGAGWTLVDTPRAQPAEVVVRGPAARVAALTAVPTVPMPLVPADSVFSRSVALDSGSLRGIHLSPTHVQVSGHVDRVMGRTLTGVPISVGDGVVVRPATVEVRVSGPQSLVAPLTPQGFRVVVAIDSIPAQLPPDGVQVPLRIERLRPGIEAALSPRAVRLLPLRTLPDTVERSRPEPAADSAEIRNERVQ